MKKTLMKADVQFAIAKFLVLPQLSKLIQYNSNKQNVLAGLSVEFGKSLEESSEK